MSKAVKILKYSKSGPSFFFDGVGVLVVLGQLFPRPFFSALLLDCLLRDEVQEAQVVVLFLCVYVGVMDSISLSGCVITNS